MAILQVIPFLDQSASESLATDRYLLRAMRKSKRAHAPVLRCSSPPSATLLFGRYQRMSTALIERLRARRDLVVQRRHTGGRLMPAGDGFLNVSLVMPDAREILPTLRPGSIPPEKVMNRYVRGILKGANALGARLFYPGREFITVQSKKIGWVSFEIDEAGAVLFECVIAWRQSFAVLRQWLAESTDLFGEPAALFSEEECCTLEEVLGRSVDRDELIQAVVNGYAGHLHLEVQPRDFNALEHSYVEVLREGQFLETDCLSMEAEDEEFPFHAVTPIQLGGFEAQVSLHQERFLKEVRLSGEYVASSQAVAALERELRLCPAEWKSIGLITDRVLDTPNHFILGLGSRRVIPDTIIQALTGSGEPAAKEESNRPSGKGD